ncbi:MAG TPA: hypothetical protein PLO89_03750, partial [Spirochaetota bacterium]|nr:hypothetical protein [Spirochaetota bacterium]
KSLNKNVIAELVGFSSKYGKNPDIYSECYKEALNMANLNPKDLYLISSGINGVRNERFFLTYQKTFSDCKHIPIVTNKEIFGECYGASGALQIASALASDLENVKGKYFAVDNFSIDGNNCVLIFKT